MDTLDLISTDDDVLKSSAVLELEDGVLVATFRLASALDTTAIGLHSAVKRAADDLGLGILDISLAGRNVEAEGALNELRSWGGRCANGEGAEEGSGNKVEGRHCCIVSRQLSSQWICVVGNDERKKWIGKNGC